MLSKTSKIFLGIYVIVLLIILFIPPIASFDLIYNLKLESFTFFSIFIIAGFLTLLTLIFVTNDINKLQANRFTKVLRVIVLNLLSYSLIILCYFFGNIEKGVGWFPILIIAVIIVIVSICLSLIIGISQAVFDKKIEKEDRII